MKEWMVWVIVILGVAAIVLFAWWLTNTFSTTTCYYISVAVNGIVFCYLLLQKNKKS